jgi:hypothetical protein
MAQQQPMQAMDTFVATMADGSDRMVTKGEILPSGHELVKRDRDGSGTLFRRLDLGEDEPAPAKSEPAKAEAPAKAAPVKAPAGGKASLECRPGTATGSLST